jgi:hypothetical protein
MHLLLRTAFIANEFSGATYAKQRSRKRTPALKMQPCARRHFALASARFHREFPQFLQALRNLSDTEQIDILVI